MNSALYGVSRAGAATSAVPSNRCLGVDFCQYQVNQSVPVCPLETCPPNCVCSPGAANCTLCLPGYTNVGAACTEVCAPNCFDCDSGDVGNGTCLSQCARGWTNFPACNVPCPAGCLACGGSWAGSNLTSSDCLWCADLGAMPPACTDCFPSVCRSADGSCDTQCTSEHGALGVFDWCEDCHNVSWEDFA